ncbi:MAG TPA: hypothetical protein DCY23_05700 [Ruminococcaceae bacterium]|nr:hypothetical protein [Oscillospiraceae bacterium]
MSSYILDLFLLYIFLFNCVGFSNVGFACIGLSNLGFSNIGFSNVGFSDIGCSLIIYSVPRSLPCSSRSRVRVIYPSFSNSVIALRMASTFSRLICAKPCMV